MKKQLAVSVATLVAIGAITVNAADANQNKTNFESIIDSVKEKVHVVDSSYVLDKATVGELDASKVLLRADSGNFIEMIILN